MRTAVRPLVAIVAVQCGTLGCSGTGTLKVGTARPNMVATSDDAGLTATPIDGGADEWMHGVLVRDPYRWLEKGDDPAVKAWVDRQDTSARTFLTGLPDRAALHDDLERIRQGQSKWLTLPFRRGGRYLYGRRDAGHDRGVLYEYDPATGRESAILDLDANIDGNLVITSWVVSPEGRYVACRLSPFGGDVTQGRIFDVRSGAWLPDRIADIRYGYPSWLPSSEGFFYTWSPTDPDMTADKRTAQSEIRYHALHTDGAKDVTVKAAPGEPGVIEVPGVSPDGRWLLAVRWSGTTKNALALLDRKDKQARWRSITPLSQYRYETTFAKHSMLVSTREGGDRATIYQVDYAKPRRDDWRAIMHEREGATLDGIDMVGDYVVLEYLENGGTQQEIHRLDGTLVKNLPTPPLGEISSLSGSATEEEGALCFGTYTQPYTPYRIRPPEFAFERFPTARAEGEDPYVTQKVFYTSPDGSRAPVYVVRARTTPAQKPAPLILYGYGGFGERIRPGYAAGIEAWLDRGGIYAEAVLRGGGEFGQAWHEAGMREKRVNVYTDFLSAAEQLIHDGWTEPSKLVARGASAGGLLVAVAMTERPDLFAGIVSEVPLTDMIRFEKGIGNGPLWVDEYGSPEDDKVFPTLLRYSPYHRVRSGVKYPPLLVMSAENDDRTDPMHARKFVAALEAAAPGATVLLRTERDAAHGGPTTESTWVDSEADVYAFALQAVHARGRP